MTQQCVTISIEHCHSLPHLHIIYMMQLLDEFSTDDAIDDPLSLLSEDIIPASSRAELENLDINITKNLNYSEYRRLINESVLSFSMDELLYELELLANATMVCMSQAMDVLIQYILWSNLYSLHTHYSLFAFTLPVGNSL